MIDEDKSRHDFRNQLGIILGFSDILLAEVAAGDPRRGDFEEIHQAATAALDVIERLFPIDADTPSRDPRSANADVHSEAQMFPGDTAAAARNGTRGRLP
ncbi:MAG: hypothetical protein A3G27_11730 [Betaproteobacteria bacterium RIFCSPLOWO2_12_FULL_66_14]|nr:MAG: hypothetical protein A3G27_11730 [Betaproteobacteria bacterium RIFCSPLOWO2_12_FULL_66_14]